MPRMSIAPYRSTQRAIARYANCEIDSVYVLFNEFKSVIAQRLVVEQILPIEQIGVAEVKQAEGMTLKEKEQALEAAREAGVGIRPALLECPAWMSSSPTRVDSVRA